MQTTSAESPEKLAVLESGFEKLAQKETIPEIGGILDTMRLRDDSDSEEEADDVQSDDAYMEGRYRRPYFNLFDWEKQRAEDLFGLQEPRTKQILRLYFYGGMGVPQIQENTKTGIKRILRVLDCYISFYGTEVVPQQEAFEKEVRGWYRTLVGDILLDRLFEAERVGLPAPSLRDLAAHVAAKAHVRAPSPSTVANILYDDLGYRYVNCARRFNPAPTRETEYCD